MLEDEERLAGDLVERVGDGRDDGGDEQVCVGVDYTRLVPRQQHLYEAVFGIRNYSLWNFGSGSFFKLEMVK
jgi:hypothetical protein